MREKKILLFNNFCSSFRLFCQIEFDHYCPILYNIPIFIICIDIDIEWLYFLLRYIDLFYFAKQRSVICFKNIYLFVFVFFFQTFHTPSFGDEEFDIPPINLPPTTPGSDTNSSDVYGSTHVRTFSCTYIFINSLAF